MSEVRMTPMLRVAIVFFVVGSVLFFFWSWVALHQKPSVKPVETQWILDGCLWRLKATEHYVPPIAASEITIENCIIEQTGDRLSIRPRAVSDQTEKRQP